MSSRKAPSRQIKCPTCNKTATWSPDNRWRPFCSERCKLIDLGDWFDEQHRIPDKPHHGSTFEE
jgi:endogenous inhibitor of DNA gyrase (YacG/DUF329 family)